MPFAHQHPADVGDFEEEEISDLDVLAEADADDDDLLAATASATRRRFRSRAVEDFAEPAQLTPPPEEPYYDPQPETPQEAYDAAPEQTPRPRDEFVHDVFTPPPIADAVPSAVAARRLRGAACARRRRRAPAGAVPGERLRR